MKYLPLSLLIVCTTFIGFAQQLTPILDSLAALHGLSKKDVAEYRISSDYERPELQMRHIYLQQKLNGYPVYNALFQIHIKNGRTIVFHNSTFYKNAASLVDFTAPNLDQNQALNALKLHFNLQDVAFSPLTNSASGFSNYDCETCLHPVRIQLAYLPNKNGKLNLVYEIAVDFKKIGSWKVFISAADGTLIHQQNRTISCQFHVDGHHEHCGEKQVHFSSNANGNKNIGEAAYNAFPLYIESPIHGERTTVQSDELPQASPFGWHDTDGQNGAEHTITRGNNVWAHEDTLDIDEPGYSPDAGPDLDFDYSFDPSLAPLENLDASITNLFVWNNYLHDISYFYGFDEVSGNFQENNYNGLGAGEDFVFAHAFDGSGTNNANMATPEDGLNPRMQMYVWNHISGSLLDILEPSTIAGAYTTGASSFGVAPPDIPIVAEVVLVDDGTANSSLGCSALVNEAEVAGKIAFINRGTCTFVTKVLNAQNAGAVAVIIANNQGTTANTLGGNDNGMVNIPAISVSQADGQLIQQQLANGTTVIASLGGTFDAVSFDSSFDNGIIAHEYGHGISNRLTGGPDVVDCLWNDEQMGEGWSDFFSLITTDTLGSEAQDPRGIGNFASNNPANGGGIRTYPYTVNMTVNPFTYEDIQFVSIPHGVGSVWATILWDMYWAFVDEYGHSYDLYSNNGGNNMAIRLVMEGMRMQACEPGFIDGRDAILAADNVLYNGDNQCLIWRVFANRGVGDSADQGSTNQVGDETEAFDLPEFCNESGVGLSKPQIDQIILYPNPGDEFIKIKTTGNTEINQIVVRNIYGQSVLVFDQLALESEKLITSELSKGVYFIEVSSNQGKQVISWVKR